jgi:peroxiredoxin
MRPPIMADMSARVGNSEESQTIASPRLSGSGFALALVMLAIFAVKPRNALAHGLQVGEPAPDFAVQLLRGDRIIHLSDFRGRRVLIFAWASWWTCGAQLPVWQKFYEAHRRDNFEILAVAMDRKSSEGACDFADRAAATFTVAVDTNQVLWKLYGFRTIPNGFFVDEQGTLRYVKIGEFDGRNSRDVQAVEKLLAGSGRCPAILSAQGCQFFQSIDLGSWRTYPQ